MYKLYYMQGACSLATQVVLHELGQAVQIIDTNNVDNFTAINPVGSVPVLVDHDKSLTEGAAIMLYLLNKHENSLIPTSGEERQKAIEEIMFANATMHPAYSKLFFIGQNIIDENAKLEAYDAASKIINNLWRVVENKLEKKETAGSYSLSAADILLAVYATWGQHHPVNLVIGERAEAMLARVQSMPSFKKAVEAEQNESNK